MIYIAISKETGEVMCGAKGQYAFGNIDTLKRSLGQMWLYEAREQGCKVRDLYNIYGLDEKQAIQVMGRLID